ncbi:MAG: DNA double-strand break repair nuclease NurA [Bacteroidota bacterium]|nr:DNA double-strand break repair nuclease NurA [Bacteroidota bacterium]
MVIRFTQPLLNLQDIAQQVSALVERERPEFTRLRTALAQAKQALLDYDHGHYPIEEKAREVPWLVARPMQSPAQSRPAPARPAPFTAVAADGSQIFPDPHYTLECCLVQVSRIAFQYGTGEPPVMEADAQVAIREILQLRQALTPRLVTAWRDQLELEGLLAAARAARRPDRPLVAIADGTLIRWMLQAIEEQQIEEQFIARFTELLSEFRREQIPICAYTSLPNATEVTNLLRLVSENEDLVGLRDRHVFAELLLPGERSALFESSSHIKKAYDPDDQVFFFYVSVEGDIGRVEVPRWVAENEVLVNLLHAFIVSECTKGNGYPMILTEAHEKAVIRAGERDLFYFMLERELAKSGVNLMESRKVQSKRRPVV